MKLASREVVFDILLGEGHLGRRFFQHETQGLVDMHHPEIVGIRGRRDVFERGKVGCGLKQHFSLECLGESASPVIAQQARKPLDGLPGIKGDRELGQANPLAFGVEQEEDQHFVIVQEAQVLQALEVVERGRCHQVVIFPKG